MYSAWLAEFLSDLMAILSRQREREIPRGITSGLLNGQQVAPDSLAESVMSLSARHA
jgi:hypothetical protein